MTTEMTTSPLFVVGPSRSGTALTRALYNRHPEVALAGETHYFDDLRLGFAGRTGERLTDPAEQRACEDYFLALSHRPYGHAGEPEKGTMARDDLRKEADALGGSPDAYFEAYCRLYARDEGASRWGEKTPRHVFRIPQILELYPNAQVTCLVRDPRGVVASYRDWENQGGFDLEADPDHARVLAEERDRTSGSYHPVMLALLWNGQVKAMVEARDRFGEERVRIQRYEDLVADGPSVVKGLCDWAGLDFSEEMLEVPMQNSSFSRFSEGSGISRDAVARWRAKLADAEVAMIQSSSGSLMKTFGYEPLDVKPSAAELAKGWGTFPVAAARALVMNRHRTGSLPVYVARRLRLIAGSLADRRAGGLAGSAGTVASDGSQGATG